MTDDGKLRRKKKRSRRPRSALRDEIFNLPNMLTMGRVFVIPLVVWCMAASDDLLSGAAPARRMAFWATSLFAAASVTDFLDGWLARNLDMQSTFGRFLDPLADKLLVMACLIELVALDRAPDWLVVLLLSREVAITGLRGLAAEEGFIVASDRFGKWKTALQMCGLIGLLIHFPAQTDFVLFGGLVDYHRVGMVLLLISMVFSVISAVGYMAAFIRTTFQAHASKVRSAN